jgi:hypothetical protein
MPCSQQPETQGAELLRFTKTTYDNVQHIMVQDKTMNTITNYQHPPFSTF